MRPSAAEPCAAQTSGSCSVAKAKSRRAARHASSRTRQGSVLVHGLRPMPGLRVGHTAMDKDASQTLQPPPSPTALDAADLRTGGYVSIVMFAAGATLLPAVALPIRDMVEPVAVIAIGTVSLWFAAGFAVLTRAGRISRDSLYVGDYIWVGITAALVAASGGRSSPFFLLYPLPVLHAAAFQSAGRMTVVTVVATFAFLTPLVYDSGETALFLAVAVIAVPPTVVVAWSLSAALTTLRRQRRELAAVADTVGKLQ